MTTLLFYLLHWPNPELHHVYRRRLPARVSCVLTDERVMIEAFRAFFGQRSFLLVPLPWLFCGSNFLITRPCFFFPIALFILLPSASRPLFVDESAFSDGGHAVLRAS